MVLSTHSRRLEEERIAELLDQEKYFSEEKRSEAIEWAARVREELKEKTRLLNNPNIHQLLNESDNTPDEVKTESKSNLGAKLMDAVNNRDTKRVEDLIDTMIAADHLNPEQNQTKNIQEAFLFAAKKGDIELVDFIHNKIDEENIITPEIAQDVATYGVIQKNEALTQYATQQLGVKDYTIDEVLTGVVKDRKFNDLKVIIDSKYNRVETSFDYKNIDHLALRAAYTQAFVEAAIDKNYAALSYMSKNGFNLIDTVQVEEILYFNGHDEEARKTIESALELHRETVALNRGSFNKELPLIQEAIIVNHRYEVESKIEKAFPEISSKKFDKSNMFHYYKLHQYNQLLEEAVFNGRKEIVEYMLLKGGSMISNSTVQQLINTVDKVKHLSKNENELANYQSIRDILVETSYKEKFQIEIGSESNSGKTQESKMKMIELAGAGKLEEIQRLESEGVVSRANVIMPGFSSLDRYAIVPSDLILMAAVKNNQTETAKYLIEKNYSQFIDQYGKRYEEGADGQWRVQAQNQLSKALLEASKNGNSELTSYLTQNTGGIITDFNQRKALEIAMKNENVDVAKSILEAKHFNQHSFVEKINGTSIKNKIDSDFLKAAKEGDVSKTEKMLKTYYPHLDDQRYFNPKNTYHVCDKVLVEKAIQVSIQAKNKELADLVTKKTDKIVDHSYLKEARNISNRRNNHHDNRRNNQNTKTPQANKKEADREQIRDEVKQQKTSEYTR